MIAVPYKTIVENIVEAVWNNGDLTAIDDLFAYNFVYHLPFSPNTLNGRQSFKQWVQMMRTAMPDLRVTINGGLVAEGVQVTGRWTMTGTQVNALAFFPATGKWLEVEGMFTYRFDGGCVAEVWDMYDVFHAMHQLGMLPELDALAVG